MQETLRITYRWARRIAILVAGVTVVLIGVAMLVLPGPGLVVIPAGLAILGVEFAWARHWLRKLKAGGAQVYDRVRNGGMGMKLAASVSRDRASPASRE